MPLMKGQIDVPITAGVDDFADPKQSRGLDTSQNVYVNREGEVQRRDGLDRLSSSVAVSDDYRSSSAAITEAVGLFEWGGRPLLVASDEERNSVFGIDDVLQGDTGQGVYLPLSDSAATPWRVIGEHAYFAQETEAGRAANNTTFSCGMAEIDDYECWAWTSKTDSAVNADSTLHWVLKDKTTGAWFGASSEVLTTLANNPQVYVGVAEASATSAKSFIIISSALPGGTSIIVKVITPSTGAAASHAVTATGFAGASWHACQGTENSKVCVLLATDNAGTLRLTKIFSDTFPRAQNTNVALNDATADYLAVCELSLPAPGPIAVAIFREGASETHLHIFDNEFGAAEAPIESTSETSGSFYTGAFRAMEIWGGYHSEMAVGPTSGAASEFTHSVIIALGTVETNTGSFEQATTYVLRARWDQGGGYPLQFSGNFLEFANAMPGCGFNWQERSYLPLHIGATVQNSAASQYAYNRVLLLRLRHGTDGKQTPVLAGVLVPQDAGTFDVDITTAGTRFAFQTFMADDGPLVAFRAQVNVLSGAAYSTADPVIRYNSGIARLTQSTRPPSFVKSRSDVLISGPLIRHVDGQCNELGFVFWPEVSGYTYAAGDQNGVHGLAVVYEYADALGQVHRSGPSEIISTSDLTLFKPTLYTPVMTQLIGHRTSTIEDSSKAANAGAIPYRSSDDGQPPHRSNTNPFGLGWTEVADPAHLTYTVNDVNLSSTELLYSAGGVLPNAPVPSSDIMLAHLERIFLVSAFNPKQLWPSHARRPGIGPEFSAATVLELPSSCTGLGALDNYLAVFTADSVQLLGGAGPNLLGVGAFAPLQEVSSSVGCGYPNSVVGFDGGVLFKSKNAGWHLLTRSFEVVPVGLPVRDYDAHEVYRATLCPKKRQIRVVHNPSDSTDVLVFDTLRNKWDTIVYGGVTPQDTCEIDGTIHVLDTAGVVYTEDDTTNINDNGTAFTPKLVSQWVNNEQGDFQRIYWVKLVGEWPSSGDLTVKYYYDYSSTAAQTQTVDVSTINADGVFRLKPARAQCKAFRIELSGAIYRISKVSLEVGQRPGRVGRVTSPTVT